MYESKIYVVLTSNHYECKVDKYWAEVVGVFNLGSVFDEDAIKAKYNSTSHFIYADDGETEILEDKYGDELVEIPIDSMIKELENVVNLDRNITKWSTISASSLLSFCNEYRSHFTHLQSKQIVCLHYGY